MAVSTQSAKTHDGETTVKKANGKTLYGAVAEAKDQKERRDSGQYDVNMTDADNNDDEKPNAKSDPTKGDGASYTKEQGGVKGKNGKQVYGAAAKAMEQKGTVTDDDDNENNDDDDQDQDQDQTETNNQSSGNGQGTEHTRSSGGVKSKDGKKVYGVAAEKMKQKGNAADADDSEAGEEVEDDQESPEQHQSKSQSQNSKGSGSKYDKSSGGVKNADGKMVYGAAAKALKAQGKGEEQQDDQDDAESQQEEQLDDIEEDASENEENNDDDDDAAYVPPTEEDGNEDEDDEPAEDAKSGSQSPQQGTKRGRTTKSSTSSNKKQKEEEHKETVGSRHDPAEAPGKQGSKDRLPKKGQQVHWKALPGYVDGTVVEVVTEEKEIDGKTYKGSENEPRIVLKSSSSGKMCVHKPDAVYFD